MAATIVVREWEIYEHLARPKTIKDLTKSIFGLHHKSYEHAIRNCDTQSRYQIVDINGIEYWKRKTGAV